MLKKFINIALLSALLFGSSTLKAQNYSTGLRDTPDEDMINAPIQVPMTEALYRSMGSAASLKQYAPTPGDQDQFGTCAAWATGYGARTIIEAYRAGITDKAKITAMAFSPAFIFRVTNGDEKVVQGKRCWGANVGELCEKMQSVGIPLLKEFPSLCVDKLSEIPKPIYQKAKPNTITGYVQLWNERNFKTKTVNEKVNAVKTSIRNGKPVIISMFTTKSFNRMPKTGLWVPLKSEVPGDYKGDHGRHAMVIVGFDDKVNGGSFEVQNSWGTDWGNGGYFWVTYTDMHNFIYGAVELQSLPELKVEETVNLAGAFALKLGDNTPMMAKTSGSQFVLNKAYESGTRFRMYIDNNEPAYVYAFGADGTNKTFQIFPHLPNVNPLLEYKHSQVAIPSEKHTIRMDGTVGTDYFCVLYSKLPLNVEEIRTKVEQQQRGLSFEQKLKNVLGNKLISNPTISVDTKGTMKFKATGKGGAHIVSLITEMKHI